MQSSRELQELKTPRKRDLENPLMKEYTLNLIRVPLI